MKKYLLLFLTLTSINSFAQTDYNTLWEETKKDPNLGKQVFIQYKLHLGNHLYTGITFEEYLQDGYIGNELRFGWQTDGRHDWEKALNFPMYGLGIYSGTIGDPQAVGNPAGLYGFIHFPLWRRPKHHFDIEIALGLTYDLVSYNAETNPDNDAIGSSIAVYFNFNFGGSILLNKKWDLTYGLDLTHFSNGRTFTPNYGINMVGINLGGRYHFNPIRKGTKLFDPEYEPRRRPEFFDRKSISKPITYGELGAYGAIGTVMYEVDGGRGPRYVTWTTYLEWRQKISHISILTVGIDWMYDGSLFENYKEAGYDAESITNLDLMLGGVHFGHALLIQRFSIELQFGIYFKTPEEDWKGSYYLRPALRYNISKKWYAQVGLKTTDGGKADWVEYGFGLRLFNTKKEEEYY